MPTRDRRRRLRLNQTPVAFSNEASVRKVVAAVRAAYPSDQAAEESEEWRQLRPRVVRWILENSARPDGDEWAHRMARVYLVKSHLLPVLPPAPTPIR